MVSDSVRELHIEEQVQNDTALIRFLSLHAMGKGVEMSNTLRTVSDVVSGPAKHEFALRPDYPYFRPYVIP